METYPKYEVNHRVMRNWQDALLYWHVFGGTLMEKLDHMTPWHVLLTTGNEVQDGDNDEVRG